MNVILAEPSVSSFFIFRVVVFVNYLNSIQYKVIFILAPVFKTERKRNVKTFRKIYKRRNVKIMLGKGAKPIHRLFFCRLHYPLVKFKVIAQIIVVIKDKIRVNISNNVTGVKKCFPVSQNCGNKRSAALVYALSAVKNLFVSLKKRLFQHCVKLLHGFYLMLYNRKIHVQLIYYLRFNIREFFVTQS